MVDKVVYIQTLNDSRTDFHRLFELYDTVHTCDDSVVRFDFSRCKFLRPNAIAFLGGLARQIESYKKHVEFDWDSLSDTAVKTNLRQNGFMHMFGDTVPPWEGNSIPYREDSYRDVDGIVNYLERYWLGKGWVQVSSSLRDAIAGYVWEIYNNAFEHSDSQIGVFTCGQYFKKDKTLLLSVIDFGQGIPDKIRYFLSQRVDQEKIDKLTSATCLRWAFQYGNTTKEELGGVGLDLLKAFIRSNQGKLEIYSNDGYAIIDKYGEQYENCQHVFKGTAVHITLRCDEGYYRSITKAADLS